MKIIFRKIFCYQKHWRNRATTIHEISNINIWTTIIKFVILAFSLLAFFVGQEPLKLAGISVFLPILFVESTKSLRWFIFSVISIFLFSQHLVEVYLEPPDMFKTSSSFILLTLFLILLVFITDYTVSKTGIKIGVAVFTLINYFLKIVQTKKFILHNLNVKTLSDIEGIQFVFDEIFLTLIPFFIVGLIVSTTIELLEYADKKYNNQDEH